MSFEIVNGDKKAVNGQKSVHKTPFIVLDVGGTTINPIADSDAFISLLHSRIVLYSSSTIDVTIFILFRSLLPIYYYSDRYSGGNSGRRFRVQFESSATGIRLDALDQLIVNVSKNAVLEAQLSGAGVVSASHRGFSVAVIVGPRSEFQR